MKIFYSCLRSLSSDVFGFVAFFLIRTIGFHTFFLSAEAEVAIPSSLIFTNDDGEAIEA